MMWNPYTNRYEPDFPYNRQPFQQVQQVVRVNGQQGANALQLAPNSSIIVADETDGNRLFLCMTDGAGFKTVRPIRCQFESEEPQQDKFAALDARIKALEDRINVNTAST